MKRLIVFLIAFLSLIGFSSNKPVNPVKPVKNYDYAAAWTKVYEFVDKGLPESAMKQVDEIYENAKAGDNAPQLVKAVIYSLKLTQYKQEDAFVKNLNRLQKETKDAGFPAKPLLHSMLAETYWNYYLQNRYMFSQRSQTVDFKNEDISTWSLEKIIEETVRNYELSLADEEKSKKIPVDTFENVLSRGNEMGKAYRPTLFDFLAHRALLFYMGTEPDITKPAYSFTINSADYLKDADSFCKLEIIAKDSLSRKYHALLLMQDLIRFHLNDKQKEALINIDLERLSFVNQYLTLHGKEELYLKALTDLEERMIRFPVSTIVTSKISQIWIEKGAQYSPLQSEEHKWDVKKAYEICDAAISRFPDSDGANMCYNLQQQMLLKSVSAQLEKVNVPDLPFRALVSYRNFSQLYWRILKVDRNDVRSERKKWQNNYNVDREQKFLEHFLPINPVRQGSLMLPDDRDYQTHTTEIKLDGLHAGDYMVLFSFNPDFRLESNNMTYTFATVSNLSYIHRNLDNGSTDFYILNRSTGEPISGARLQAFFSVYNSRQNQYETVRGEVYTTDSSGYVNVPYQYKEYSNYYYNSFNFDISTQNDFLSSLDIDTYEYYYGGQFTQYRQEKPGRSTQTLFFLDRGIYRPGQTLYFKGLVYSTDGKDPQIVTKHNYTVTFFDVNFQVVAQQQVTTNDYGTFSGTFTTPSKGLMGQMTLEINDNAGSTTYFSVEEYKRPKFEVKFDRVKGSFRLGEQIKTTGKATAYSGANIDGAEVKYRVVRSAQFPYWWLCWYGYYPSSPEMEITNGVTHTDADGKFEIDFTAIPDETVNRESDPTFTYAVYADVTDINGETHSGQSWVNIGYKALEVGVDIADIDLNNDKSVQKRFGINTNNLDGEFEPAAGTITIWKLKNPDRAYRQRMWPQPDKHTISPGEFRKDFPHDLYADENNFFKWDKEKETFTIRFNTSQSKEFEIKNLKTWIPGKYYLEIVSKDKFGQDVKEVAYFDVFDPQHRELSYPGTALFKDIMVNCEPGEEALLQAGSSEKISLLYEIERDGNIICGQRLTLNDEQKTFRIPVLESYRGNIAVHFAFVKDSRLYTHTTTVTVPYSNKQLDIRFETFRDKLHPGEQEQWKIRVSGPKSERIMAEMAATLYDASLDAFRANSWYANFYNPMYARLTWNSVNCFEQEQFRSFDKDWNNYYTRYVNLPSFDHLNWFGFNLYDYYRYGYKSLAVREMSRDEVTVVGYGTLKKAQVTGAVASIEAEDMEVQEAPGLAINFATKEGLPPAPPQAGEKLSVDMSDVKMRTNFNETAFYYPQLETDENGEIIIKFTVPEALTRWKMLGFAHTKDLQSGSIMNELVTQKDLMVVPNQPRFFRENDKMIFSAKITSLAENDLEGNARLEFFDALTMKPINALMKNSEVQKSFSIKAKQSTHVEWSIEIPEGVQAITYHIAAKAGNFSDGEEMAIPVVTNRMLVTETMPMPIWGKQTKNFKLDKLVNNSSTTLRNQRFTLEFTSNPAWYAVQALPYMMEYPYECTEQTFSRFYANSIAAHIANSNPKIKKVFDTWRTIQPDALLSNLEKNQELKTALLEETPWVLNAKDESQRKRNVALLFDLNRMANEQERALKKIMEAQTGNGGFSWFPGFPEDRYITQHIVAGFGHLDVMGVKSVRDDDRTWEMIEKALDYMDRKMRDYYEHLKELAKQGFIDLNDNHLDYLEIHYLYTRSYFKDVEIPDRFNEAFNYFLGQAKKYWLKNSIYMQGMMVLALDRYGNHNMALDIVKSLSERALHSEEMGMYWKLETGYFWYQAPIETQALMVEVYDEVSGNRKAVEELKAWLLKQKQVQDWKTTKATSEACYALLRRGTNLLASDTLVEVTVGKEKIDPLKRPDVRVEAGTGYFKTAWTASEITPDMGNIQVSKKNEGIAWGAVYWQYFEQLDKITPAETPLKLQKQLFLQQNTDRGPVITPVTEETVLHVGDLIKVRIELRVDRTMEYIHLKDMRAAAFEPVETLSTFKYQDGLYYYQSPRDLATNFFIGWLPKGTYVFEYSLRVSQKGDFSNGITTIQCMYAPEFSSHSEGIRVQVR